MTMKREEKTKVLLVHHHAYTLYMLRETLKKEGYAVYSARTGEEGVRHLKKEKPDLISLDLNLPKRSGIMFYHHIRRDKYLSRIPMIVVSGGAGGNGKKVAPGEDNIFAGRRVFGPSVYLEKPVKLEDYLQIVHKSLGAKPETILLPSEIEAIRRRLMDMILRADAEKLCEMELLLSATSARNGSPEEIGAGAL